MYNNKLLDSEKMKQEKTDKYFIIHGELKSQLNGKTTGYMTLRLRIELATFPSRAVIEAIYKYAIFNFTY